MINPRSALLVFTVFCAAFASAPTIGQGQVTEAQLSHKAYQRVVSYLTYAMGQDWPKSAALIEENSLKNLRDRFVGRISRARTVQEELDMCRALDCTNLDEVKTLDPTTFYIRYHEGIQKSYEVSKEKLAMIMQTKEVKLVSLAEEIHDGKSYSHVLVRTRHQNGDKLISSLELVSMLDVDGDWLVTMEAQKPTVSAVDSSAAVPKK
ncbi:MAG: hypothetical protein ACI9UA_004970, partial [Pseudoalteromonas tetraodonis]